jgi:hypothetical protein
MREQHPIQDDAPAPTVEALVREVHLLKCLTAQLWDEVWWHQLPFYRRWYYALVEGHRSPIRSFYIIQKTVT